jgi:hypothetical protein
MEALHIPKKKNDKGEETVEWLCRNGRLKDFLTLMSFTIIYRLSAMGNYFTCTFNSGDGALLFVVLKANLKKLKQEAQEKGANKQFELGAVLNLKNIIRILISLLLI